MKEGYTDPINAYDIIIVAGQSNSVGYSYEATINSADGKIPIDKITSKFTSEDLAPLPNLYILERDPDWKLRPERITMLNKEPDYMRNCGVIPASEPMSYHSTSYNAQASIGFYRTFAKNYINANPGKKVLIIHNGFEACGIFTPYLNHPSGRTDIQWNIGGALYSTLVKRVNNVLSWNPNNKVVAILWSQGEADIDNTNVTVTQYINEFKKFITSLRTAIKNTNVPFIACGYSQDWHTNDSFTTKKNQFMSNLQSMSCTDYTGETTRTATPRSCAIPKFAYVSTNGVTSDKATNSNNVHFNFAGLRELGQRFWRVYSVIK